MSILINSHIVDMLNWVNRLMCKTIKSQSMLNFFLSRRFKKNKDSFQKLIKITFGCLSAIIAAPVSF